MKFSIDREQLVEALGRMQGVLPSRNTLPILANVLIEASDDAITITANDLDRVIRVSTGAGVDKGGSTTVPGKRLAVIIREMQGGDIMWTTDSKDVTSLECGPSHFKLKGLPAEEFPTFSINGESSTTITMDSVAVAGALRQTEFAQSSDESRYVLNGVLLSQFKINEVISVGTDGRRMATASFPVKVDWPRDVIIPGKAIPEIMKVLAEQPTAEVTVSGAQLEIQSDSYFATRLIEGNYPNWKQVVPAGQEDWNAITMERENLYTVIKRISTMMSEKLNSIGFTFGADTLQLRCSSPDLGEAEEALDVRYAGEKFSVGFNPHFILDALRCVSADEITLRVKDEGSPMVIAVEGQSWEYIIMPMRVGS